MLMFLRRLRFFGLPHFDARHDVIVFAFRQHTHERHHAHHRGYSASRQAVGFRLRNVIVNNHHHASRVAGRIPLFCFGEGDGRYLFLEPARRRV
jgi:hypothetical protein